MKFMKVSTLFLAGLAACIASAGSDTPAEVAKTFIAKYRKAMMTKDISFFEQNQSPDFVFIDLSGKRTPKSVGIAGIKAGFKMTGTMTRYETKLISAKPAYGGILFILDEDVVEPMNMGGKKPSIMASQFRSENLLVKVNGKWLSKWVKIQKEHDTIDGKPVKGVS